jgi:hypothetical protein
MAEKLLDLLASKDKRKVRRRVDDDPFVVAAEEQLQRSASGYLDPVRSL